MFSTFKRGRYVDNVPFFVKVLMSGSLITFIALAVVAGYLVMVFNRLVSLRNRHSNAFSQIDVQLQRRHELILSLIHI